MMLGVVGTWVKSLIIIVLLGNLAEFILPKGDLRRYTGLVVGLILLLAMVSPLWRFIQGAHPTVIERELLGAGTGQNLTAVIKTEEWNQATAMILSYPGVSSCVIRAGTHGGVEVVVSTAKSVVLSQLRSYIKGAIEIATGNAPASMQIRVNTGQTVKSFGTGNKRKE